MASRNSAVFMREVGSSSSPNREMKMADHSRWSELPNHITEMIVNRLGFPDIIRFGAVCRSWRSVYTEVRRPRYHPMVLYEYNLQKGTFGFYSFEDKKVYWINVRDGYQSRHCVGSCESWLVLSSPYLRNYFLLNPFTGARVECPYVNRPDVDLFTKVILLDSPIDLTTKETNYYCTVVALNLFSTELNICRLGDARWNVVLKLDREHFLGCLVYFKNKIYTLSTSGELWIISLSGPMLRATVEKVLVQINLTIGLEFQKECYLVEAEDYLLMVIRIKRKSTKKTVRFVIFKLVQNPGEYKWIREYNLPDDRALFLGRLCSRIVSTTEYGGLQENSIYFTDDKLLHKARVSEYPETGIYNIRSGIITPYHSFDLYPFDLPHIWITPSV
ncbi:hypothetical protein NE237_002507 [Protea cynaroides]|uniref:F-box domain-containing protein n=1 Tax=Protea cynaroides TaxID=273540 RepID=A0A9Q0KW15_9MAGN|nr:hypothetical protein NE237_002507 [Protea cynaroides]